MAEFEIAFSKLRKWEGGKVDDPVDPGGRTNAGITQKTYTRWAATWGKVCKGVFYLDDDEIRQFYQTEFWDEIKGYKIESQPLADLLLSMAVLQGKRPAVRRLQNILGLKEDGIIGDKSIEAINAADTKALIAVYIEANKNFFLALVDKRPELERFRQGWLNRVESYA